MLDRSGAALAWLTSVFLLGCGGGGDGGEGNGPALFFPPVPVVLGDGTDPRTTLVADVDRDGRPDVVVAARGTGSVVVLRGGGDGTFPDRMVWPLGAGVDPAALALAAIDDDGVADLAVADAAGDAVVLLRGTGGGVFTLFGDYPLRSGSTPSAIAAADLDADGWTDLAVADLGLSGVTLARGLGDGTFAAPEAISLGGGFRPAALAVADFDRDGRLDLAASSGSLGTVAVLRGRGDGSFRSPLFATATSGAHLEALAVGDVDRDGRLDLVTAGATSGAVFVLLGNGDGTFAPATRHAVGPQPKAIALGDFDRDGALDVAAAIFGIGGISVLRGRGDATFGPAIRTGSGGSGGAGIALGDFDRNGSLDVACANARSGSVGILLGRPHETSGRFVLAGRVPLGFGRDPEGGALADVDGDGRLDLLVASRGAGAVSVALGNGAGGFAASFDVSVGAGSGPVAVAVADFDVDGVPDVAVANASGNDVAVLRGIGGGDFDESDVVPMGGTAAPSAVAVADVDHDGIPDLVVALRGTDRVAVALGRGDGTFEGADLFDVESGSEPAAVVAADFDHDGWIDVAAAGPGSPSVSLLLSDSVLGLGPPILSFVGDGAEPTDLDAADLDGDGRLDLLVPDRLGGAVVALLSDGGGTFFAAPPASAGAGVSVLAAADLDRDGLEDAAAARLASDGFRLLWGRGDGTFGQGTDLDSGGDGPVAVLVADLDEDGALDLVVLHRTTDEAVVFLGS